MSTATLERTIAPATIRSARRPVRPVPPTLPARTRVRLTRRGRLTLVLLIAVLALIVTLIGAGAVSAVTSAPARPAATTTVVVQPGQTLWGVAEKVAPGRDPRDVVKRISDLNALSSPVVAPGQPLLIPAF